MAMATKNSVALIRSAIGASAWFMPLTAGRLFAMNVSNDVSAALFLRLGGSRDFALAAGPLVTEGAASARMLKIAAACDIGDIIAVEIARRRGKLSRFSSLLFTAASVGCLGLSVKAIAEQPPR
jgi:hypothetical protein